MRKTSLKHDGSGKTCEICKFCEVKMSEYPCRACMRAGCYGDMWKPAEDLTPDNRPKGIYERIATMWGGYLRHPIDAWDANQMLKMVIVIMDDMTREGR